MEFPELGSNCTREECHALDFLPFNCSYCKQIFCKDHYNPDTHQCTALKEMRVSQVASNSFVCSQDGCTTCSPVQMPCPKCKTHFCLVHRYHDCFDTKFNFEERKRIWRESKEKFANSLKNVNKEVNENIQKAIKNPKKQETALKVQLMKLKGKATGTKTIPMSDRVYFLLHLPKELKMQSKPIFFSQDWSVGKAIDSASSICKIVNKNNENYSPKLRLFKTSGIQISTDMGSKLQDLLNNNNIYNGETLILEYVNHNEDLQSYILADCSEYNNAL